MVLYNRNYFALIFNLSLINHKDIRMLRILLLGSISGFPWVLIASSLSLWLKEEGLSRSTIGWAGLIFGVYAFNYLWAPIIDRIQIPFLTKRLGHRRGWIVLMQIIILMSLVIWSFINPTENLALLISVGLVIAIASATQDITVDALRIEQIQENEGKSMAAGAAMAVVGWWTGYKLGGVVALFTAEFFQNMGIPNYWQTTFLVLGIVIILMNIGLMFVHEPVETDRQSKQKETDKMIERKLGSNNMLTNFVAYITGTIGGPIISFFKKNGYTIAIGILGFVFLFKIGEAFLGRMSIVFYKEIGFSKGEIAIYSKTLGWITTVIFTLLGGIFAMRSGTVKTMFVAGGFMAATNLLFALLAWSGKSELLFAIAVVADDISAAFATVAFVAFISLLVDRTYTATQYALLASIGTAGRTTLASSSGALVDWLNGDWGTFFIITTVMVIPSLICLWFIKDKLKLVQNNFYCIKPFINLYEKPSIKSGLASQILYGEKFNIIKKYKKFLKIKTHFDKYIGYIEKKNFEKSKIFTHKIAVLRSNIYSIPVDNKKYKTNNFLPFSSNLKILKKKGQFIEYHKNKWIKKSDIKPLNFKNKNFSKIIKLFLNTKYKWGGKLSRN